MGIWGSVDGGDPEVRALNCGRDAAYYRGEGSPTGWIDVATTGFHSLIRLSVQDDANGIDTDVLLDAAAARLLAARLEQAAALKS